MLTLIRGGRIVDPGNMDGVGDILIEEDRIIQIGSNPDPGSAGLSRKPDRVIDAAGKIVSPGLIDMHVHLREPGQEYKETIETGCRAAASGGFTTICCMPNTHPVNDNAQIVEYIISRAKKVGLVRVLPVGAISMGLAGNQLSEYSEMKNAGAVAVSDDGRPVSDSLLMRRALEYAKGFGLLVISHCEDLSLSANGSMNEGVTSTRMGLAGIPNAAESIMVLRDIALCELTGAPLHIAHVSTKESVEAIRRAKQRGIPVTAETAPHYFTLTEEAVKNYNTHAKMNPPLRTEKDVAAIQEALADGTLDVIATDHAPHAETEKNLEFDQASNGIVGLETSLALGLNLVGQNILTLSALIEKMSINPAKILGIQNHLVPGAYADITLIDPEVIFEVDAAQFKSKGRNTPFNGWQLKGRALLTMVGGRVVFEDL
ncbi:MAG: dihydroorotase [Proteobacteria bacterium]|nr:dihydroorotase [Pseudomonadota bacterium]MBU4470250.1 dihydroorotase [Pseudomonadota bacterium]MCG2752665.1 dihydroorotase [Desulfobacteraceae bacterium]